MNYRRPANGFHTSALNRISLAFGPLSCLTSKPALTDHFTSFDPSIWGPSDYDAIVGEPDMADTCTMDGRCVLRMRSNMTSRERRGIATIPAFNPTKLSVELEFKPLSGVDGLMELWLIEPDMGNYIGIGVYGVELGLKRQVMSWSSVDEPSGISCNCWEYGRWYKLAISGYGRGTRVSLQNAEGKIKWNHFYPWALSDIGGRFRVNLSQSMSPSRSGVWKAEAAVDRLTVCSARQQMHAMKVVPAR
jgi:hypothetical protein